MLNAIFYLNNEIYNNEIYWNIFINKCIAHSAYAELPVTAYYQRVHVHVFVGR